MRKLMGKFNSIIKCTVLSGASSVMAMELESVES